MLKLKITTTVLALAGLVLLLMGGTYFTAAAAIVCTAMALPLAFHLTFRWFCRGSTRRSTVVLVGRVGHYVSDGGG